jgi:hypothetical protein
MVALATPDNMAANPAGMYDPTASSSLDSLSPSTLCVT